MWWKKKKTKVFEVVVLDSDNNLNCTLGFYSTMERAKARVNDDLRCPMPGTERKMAKEVETHYLMPGSLHYEGALLYGMTKWADRSPKMGTAFQWLIVEHMVDALV